MNKECDLQKTKKTIRLLLSLGGDVGHFMMMIMMMVQYDVDILMLWW